MIGRQVSVGKWRHGTGLRMAAALAIRPRINRGPLAFGGVARLFCLEPAADHGIHIVRVGSDAGLYSAAISCWPTGGENGTQPVVKVIEA